MCNNLQISRWTWKGWVRSEEKGENWEEKKKENKKSNKPLK